MPQPAVPQPKKFVYLKSVLPDMCCQFITFLLEEADRAAPEKVCVPKMGFARHALPTHYILVAEADRAATGRAAAEKFVYPKSGWPDMPCQVATKLSMKK